jgi:hypothetical protein
MCQKFYKTMKVLNQRQTRENNFYYLSLTFLLIFFASNSIFLLALLYSNFMEDVAYGDFFLFTMNLVNVYVIVLMFWFSPIKEGWKKADEKGIY